MVQARQILKNIGATRYEKLSLQTELKYIYTYILHTLNNLQILQWGSQSSNGKETTTTRLHLVLPLHNQSDRLTNRSDRSILDQNPNYRSDRSTDRSDRWTQKLRRFTLSP